MNRKGQAALYFTFIVASLVILLIGAVFAPIGVELNTRLYAAGEEILEDAQPSIDNIQDETIRAQVNASVASAKAAGSNNIQVNANIFQYSWVLMLVLLGLIIFLFTRQRVEFGRGFV